MVLAFLWWIIGMIRHYDLGEISWNYEQPRASRGSEAGGAGAGAAASSTSQNTYIKKIYTKKLFKLT